MTIDYINDIVAQVLSCFKDSHPGQQIRIQQVLTPIQRNHVMDFRKATNVYYMLLFGDMLIENNGWVELTDRGYRFIHEGGKMSILIYLPYMVNFKCPKKEQIFYDMWDIIGDGDKEVNPFYCSGKDFYECIKGSLESLPPTYSQYMKDLENDNGRMMSRSEWCRDLFLKLSDNQREPFLKKLSEYLNSQLSIKSEKLDDVDILDKDKMDTFIRKPKIFISHNTEDKCYAAALVEMMHAYGVKYEDIFCSSHPACKIPFGKSILDAIASQFNEFELIVLFVHSPRLYNSPVSLNEMGAAWILKKDCYSFLTNDCSFNELRGVIDPKVIAFKAGQEGTYANLHDFEEMLYRVFNLERLNGAAAEYIRKTFIIAVDRLENK